MEISNNKYDEFKKHFTKYTNFTENEYHPFVWILGNPEIGKNVTIGGFSEINATDALIKIGDNCDIASFVSINCSDSHKKVVGINKQISRKDILIENNVFIGSHSVIKGGAIICHHSVIAAGSIVDGIEIPPYSLCWGNPLKVKKGYYSDKIRRQQ